MLPVVEKLPAVTAPLAVTLVRSLTSAARLMPFSSTTMFPFSLAFAEIVSPVISMPLPALYSGISNSPMAVVTLSSTYFLLVASVSPVMDSVTNPVILPPSIVTPSAVTLPPVMLPVVEKLPAVTAPLAVSVPVSTLVRPLSVSERLTPFSLTVRLFPFTLTATPSAPASMPLPAFTEIVLSSPVVLPSVMATPSPAA